jgi:hypothetical protein
MSTPFTHLIQIPGPNPILGRGGPGAWDECLIEACDVFKDGDTYYLYYHGRPQDPRRWPRQGYRLGVATAKHPLGPWTRYAGNPILDLGAEGGWEGTHVACAFVHKEHADRYYMWYSAYGGKWGIGLATAPTPLGPWAKHADNPLLAHFGYVGSVVKVDGGYRLYTEHPIGETGPDYGPLSLATAPAPQGPWTPHGGNPVLRPGEWGAWDDGGYSESEVLYRDGLYHVFYGAAKLHPTRILSQESIGYAWSTDGLHFTKHAANPVAPRERSPNTAAMAEVHTLIEPPLIYCYHTLRYCTAERDNVEDIGVQILAFQRPFSIRLPVLTLPELGPGGCTELASCPPVSLEHIRSAALTVEFQAPVASAGLSVEVRGSADGMAFDTTAAVSWDLRVNGTGQARQTFAVPSGPAFIKLLCRNQDAGAAASDLRAVVVLKG